jgi:hypothetical protein
MQYKLITFLFIVLCFAGCNNEVTKPESKTLDISFHINKKDSIQPSYQIAIWLEKPDQAYYKTLFVSDYLSYGGFFITTVCPDWSVKASWDEVTKEDFDAATGATPLLGDRNFEFNCSEKQIPPGKYKFFIEVHLVDNFNELYSGEIEIAGEDNESEAQVTYLPEKHPKASDILSQVKAKYNN